MKEEEEGEPIISGDWNTRIGKKGGTPTEEKKEDTVRNFRDGTVNAEGERMLRIVEERG